ncbi:MAG: mechanosensitive ion channel family protein [Syntrophothermus sp.]
MIWSFFNKEYFGNSVSEYLASFGVFLLLNSLIYVVKRIILKRYLRRTQKNQTRLGGFIVLQINRIVIPVLYLISLYFSLNLLKISAPLKRDIDSAGIVLFTFFTIRFALLIINYSIRYFLGGRQEQSADHISYKGMSTFIAILVWGLGVVFLLDNLGFKISAVIAGLGIGGIAVALAAQAVLGDFFSYFVIFFDRPFQIGDFITVDDKAGTIDKIGIKTTRLTSISGEQIIFPNSNLTNSRVHNYKLMQKRRILFNFSIEYGTSVSTLKRIPELVRSAVQTAGDTTFDRAHLQSFGESGFRFEVVYYVNTPEYNKYMDINQRINIGILEEFQKLDVRFAYPARKLFYEGAGLRDKPQETEN